MNTLLDNNRLSNNTLFLSDTIYIIVDIDLNSELSLEYVSFIICYFNL